jgi:hypothetical protein
MPGYQEPSIHPAAYPDPEADAYENGDTSSWAEDPHPGPYPNSFHPALPGTEEPMGHPATDPAHYFPAGVTKQASRQLRAAMEAKAARCIRLATAMLGKKASVSAIEDQALDLMNLTERQIAAALKRVSSEPQAADLLAIENMTLTPERSADAMLAEMLAEEAPVAGKMSDEQVAEAMLAEMMAEEAPVAGKMSDEAKAEGLLAEMMAEEAPVAGKMSGKLSEEMAEQIAEMVAGKLSGKLSGKMSEEASDEALLASMLAEVSGKTASRRRASGNYDKMPGDQNDPAHYNFRAEGVLASAKKSEEAKADEAKAEEIAEEIAGDVKGAKKAALVRRIARILAAKKSEEAEETTAEEADEADEEPKAGKKAGMTAEVKAAIAELLADEAGPMADDLISEEAPVAEEMADDLMLDMMGDELSGDDAPVADDLMALYGMKLAGKKSEEAKAEEAEETTAEEADEQTAEEAEEAPKAGKKAALRPQARKASTGVRTLGAVSKVASGDVNDLSKLWESAPDVSKVFG